MDKQKVLEKINIVRQKRNEQHITSVLNEIEEYANSLEPFSSKQVIIFVKDKMPSKMGGIYIDVAKALRFLISELNSENNKH